MIYTNLILTNIGAFHGRYELDLSPESVSRNIILIGGKNGSGKTTLLEALRICLFGPYAFGYKTENEVYIKKVRAILNSTAFSQGEDLYQIFLEFNYTEKYRLDSFKVKRSWSLSNNNLQEHFEVLKNGQYLHDVERDLFIIKMREEIPPKLFEFCLFDGEEISRIILDDTLPQYVCQIAKVLFNLDLFENLESDLTHFISQSNYSLKPSDQEKLETTQKILRTFEEKKIMILEAKAKVVTESDQKRYELEQLKLEFASNGGLAKDERDKLIIKIQVLESRRRMNDEQIKEFVSRLLPFLLCKDILKNVQAQMITEQKDQAFNYISFILKNSDYYPLVNSLAISGDSNTPEKIVQEISKFLTSIFQPDEHESIHKASNKQTSEIERLNQELEELNIPHILKLFELGDSLLKKIQATRKKIAIHDSTQELDQYIERIEQLNKQLAFYEFESARQEQELNELDIRIQGISKELDSLYAKLHELYKNETVFNMGNKILQVSKKFRQIQLRKKLQQVEIETATLIQLLFSKDQFLSNIVINSETFELELLAADATVVNMKKLSAGEKEILLLAIIWAMVKCSGRKLPFVFDTLLGRLDKSHRRIIATKLLPKISEQVIILATDSEIDQELFTLINRHVARAYTLEYLNDSKQIRIENDFFAQTHRAVVS